LKHMSATLLLQSSNGGGRDVCLGTWTEFACRREVGRENGNLAGMGFKHGWNLSENGNQAGMGFKRGWESSGDGI
jgi:hypothetical protein